MNCCLIREPTVTVIYIFVASSAQYKRLAMRFVKLYNERAAGYPHRLVIACNNCSQIQESTKTLFEDIPNKDFHRHDNTGWDLGAYQSVAVRDQSDLLVFMGSSCFPTRSNWLRRIMESYETHGEALYGSMHHNGDMAHGVQPHIRTTGFWMPRLLFTSYPVQIKTHSQRYGFEHGRSCLTTWMVNNGYGAFTVTWENEWDFPNWRKVVNGYHQGKQSALIFRDRLTEPPFWK